MAVDYIITNSKKDKYVGKRLRAIRIARGYTQQKLGDLVGTSDTMISRYEKDGLNDAQMIDNLSRALGVDLWYSASDVEREPGIIGKEILSVLIEDCGYIEYEDLLKDHMYGLKRDTVDEEIKKLVESDLCRKEEFFDYNKNRQEALFICAKGIIAYKQYMAASGTRISDHMPMVLPIELFLGEEFENYQDFLEAHPVVNIIRELLSLIELPYSAFDCHSDYIYRRDYIYYLKEQYYVRLGKDRLIEQCDAPRSAYLEMNKRIAFGYGYDYDHMGYLLKDEQAVKDYYHGISKDAYRRLIYEYPEAEVDFGAKTQAPSTRFVAKDDNDSVLFGGYVDLDYQEAEKRSYQTYKENHNGDMSGFFKKMPSKLEWENAIYSDFEFSEYDRSLKINALCAKINALIPESVEYYRFPDAWEKAGLGEELRKIYGITLPPKNEDNKPELTEIEYDESNPEDY
ncbi:MAG: helix-turn-helix domain-containing protein [Lachnospiraceae bacterium]|nr:helix-turn-helix domain-containing protein [Lachnospiraceae bacterium]